MNEETKKEIDSAENTTPTQATDDAKTDGNTPALTVPLAIVLAGVIIAGAILFNGSRANNTDGQGNVAGAALATGLKKSTIAEEVGLDKKAFASCLESGRYASRIESDYQSGLSAGVQGTPLTIVLNTKTGKTYTIDGAQPIEVVQMTLANALAGKSDGATKITVSPISSADHIFGNPSAEVLLIEYSDPECPFCKRFQETLKTVMTQYGDNGNVAWVYRHFPLDSIHPKSRKEAEAFECAGELGGSTKFWEYADKLFEITPSNNQLDPSLL